MRNPGYQLAAIAVLATACRSDIDPSAQAVGRGEARAVLFTMDLWPGEGIPVIEVRRAVLPLRAGPEPGSPVVDTLRSRIGERIVFDSTRLQTIESGIVHVVTPMQLSGRDMGAVTHVSLDQYYSATQAEATVPLATSTVIELLQYRAEGTCFVRIDGRVIDAQPCPGFGRESVTVEREPVTRWWILVQGQGGAFGWLLVSDSTAQSVRREF